MYSYCAIRIYFIIFIIINTWKRACASIHVNVVNGQVAIDTVSHGSLKVDLEVVADADWDAGHIPLVAKVTRDGEVGSRKEATDLTGKKKRKIFEAHPVMNTHLLSINRVESFN